VDLEQGCPVEADCKYGEWEAQGDCKCQTDGSALQTFRRPIISCPQLSQCKQSTSETRTCRPALPCNAAAAQNLLALPPLSATTDPKRNVLAGNAGLGEWQREPTPTLTATAELEKTRACLAKAAATAKKLTAWTTASSSGAAPMSAPIATHTSAPTSTGAAPT